MVPTSELKVLENRIRHEGEFDVLKIAFSFAPRVGFVLGCIVSLSDYQSHQRMLTTVTSFM
jgi:hypothetical protein